MDRTQIRLAGDDCIITQVASDGEENTIVIPRYVVNIFFAAIKKVMAEQN